MLTGITSPLTGVAIGSGGSGGGANPLPIPSEGLVSMLDGSVATSFYSDLSKTTNSTEGGAVAVWEDQSGNGNDWTQPTASYRPVAQIANKRVYNQGSDSEASKIHLIGPDISGWTEGSFFARVQKIDGITNNGAIWGTTTWNNQNSLNHWDYTGTHYWCFATSTRPAAGALGTLNLMTYENNINAAGLAKIYINGTQQYSASLVNTGFRSSPYLGCGVRFDGAQYAGEFYFYKFLAYSRVVTPAERITINTWLES